MPHIEIEPIGRLWLRETFRVRMIIGACTIEIGTIAGEERADRAGREYMAAYLARRDGPTDVRRIEAWEVSSNPRYNPEPTKPPPGCSGVSPSDDGGR